MTHHDICESLLSFWFGPAGDDDAVARRQSRLWWSKHAATDRLVAERFEATLRQSLAGPLPDWPDTARGRLAGIILFDQLPRNMYRQRPEAFAWDGRALEEARRALSRGDDSCLRPIERVFLYMPFEHAENLECQDVAVERFTVLRDQVWPQARQTFQGFLDFAFRHREIIRRFGRFPHRNAILGRLSTPEERQFLLEPGSSF